MWIRPKNSYGGSLEFLRIISLPLADGTDLRLSDKLLLMSIAGTGSRRFSTNLFQVLADASKESSPASCVHGLARNPHQGHATFPSHQREPSSSANFLLVVHIERRFAKPQLFLVPTLTWPNARPDAAQMRWAPSGGFWKCGDTKRALFEKDPFNFGRDFSKWDYIPSWYIKDKYLPTYMMNKLLSITFK